MKCSESPEFSSYNFSMLLDSRLRGNDLKLVNLITRVEE